MYNPLPSFPPLFPPVDWWRDYLGALLDGASRQEAVSAANTGRKAREWMRFGGLSLPIDGGASTLKNRPADSWILSPKAALQARKMDATLATIYGSTPFYHLLDHLLSVSDIIEGREKASDVCIEAFRRIEHILGIDAPSLIESARALISSGKSCDAPQDKPSGIMEVLFRKGPEAIFTLLPALRIR